MMGCFKDEITPLSMNVQFLTTPRFWLYRQGYSHIPGRTKLENKNIHEEEVLVEGLGALGFFVVLVVLTAGAGWAAGTMGAAWGASI